MNAESRAAPAARLAPPTLRPWSRAARFCAGLWLGLLSACGGGVSLEEEERLGDAYAAEISRELALIRDPGVLAELNRFGGALAAQADSTGRDYSFYLVDSPDVNAFAIPGGHIFVNRGLIERADASSELAGVLGHEIAHVTERHGIEQLDKQRSANLFLSILYTVLGRQPGLLEQVAIQGGGAAVFAKYGRDAEREADRRAVEMVTAAGYHPEGVAAFFEELMRQQQRQPGLVEKWFSTHPLTDERVRSTRAAIEAMRIPGESRLIRDDPQYQRFRREVAALP